MVKRVAAWSVLGGAFAALMIGAGSAAAATDGAAALQSVAPSQTALSDLDMADARGAGLFGLPTGSTVFAQIGASTSSKHAPGSPSASSTSLSGGGTTLSGSSSLGPGPVSTTMAINGGFSHAESLSASRSFTISFTGF